MSTEAAEAEADTKKLFNAIDLALLMDSGLFIGRNGSTELQVILHGTAHESHILNTGIWPCNKSSLEEYRKVAEEASFDADFLVTGWYKPLAEDEELWVRGFSPDHKRSDHKRSDYKPQTDHKPQTDQTYIRLEALEPYFFDKQFHWTTLLKNQNVAIISPFADLCVQQYQKRHTIWNSLQILPENMNIIPIETGYPPAIANGSMEWPQTITKWQDAVQYIVDRTIHSKARIALIGCGAIGMLVAAQLKKHNIIAIVLGGALQNLFGIRGSRWANHPIISRFWNDAWIWSEKKPAHYKMIEGGCYW